MRILLLAAIFLVGVVLVLGNDEEEWKKFKAKYNRVYRSKKEEHKRKLIFLQYLHFIKQHNKEYEAGKTSFKMDINEFSDWTDQEWLKLGGALPKGVVQ